MANVSSSNTTTLYSTTQETPIQQGAAVTTGQVNDANWTTLYTTPNQVTPNANLVVPGTLTVNGCAILTNCTAFSLLPTTATSINFGAAATSMSIGAASGTTTINNQLATANYTFPVADGLAGQVLVTNGTGTLSFAVASSVGKDYDISASTTTGGANFNLNSNVPTTDTVKFANGSNVTVVATDANTITISSTDTNTTYDFNASSTTGGVNLNLVGSDSTTDTVKLSNGTGVTVSYVSGTEASIAIGQSVATTATPTFAGANLGNITVGVLTDNTITTTTGNLVLDSATNLVSVTADIGITGNLTAQDLGSYGNVGLNVDSTPGATAGVYAYSGPSGTTQGSLVWDGAAWTLSSNEILNGYLQIKGATSGYSQFSAPATGANISYVLPNAQGAVSTVLTNDGAGNLTWALPGGGGSTFGNITVGVVTDNTISTTTGDLVIDSATNLVNVTADLTVTGDIEYTGGDLRTTNSLSSFYYTGLGTHTFNIDDINTTSGNIKTISIGANGQSGSFTNVNIGSSVSGATSTVNLYNNVNVAGQLNATGDVFANDLGSRGNLALNYDNSPGFTAGVYAYSGALGTTQGSLVWNGTAWTVSSNEILNGYLQINGSTSGYSQFSAPATGANISYTLPGAAPAVNGYVLSSTTGGVLSWAAPTTNTTYDFNASSTTGGANLNLVGSDSTTDTVKLSNGTGVTVSYVSGTEVSVAIGQDVATTATPTFAGANLGNITVGVTDDNTINTTTGDLKLTTAAGGIITLTTDNTGPVYAIRNSSSTNQSARALTLRTDCTGTPATGIGTSLDFEVETAVSTYKRAGFISVQSTDITPGNENFNMNFGLMTNGATYNGLMALSSAGNLTVNNNIYAQQDIEYAGGDLRTTNATSSFYYTGLGTHTFNIDDINTTTGNTKTVNIAPAGQSGSTTTVNIGSSDVGATSTINLYKNVNVNGTLKLNGSTSGSSAFTAPATGSTLTYVLPGTAGAANTVLTNDGSGNLSWALPGGGGSTFGNVSIGVVTDNTISTTTGDLDITSSTGVINLDTYTAFTDNRVTTTSTALATLDSLAIATYQSASYTITIKNTVTGATQFTKIDLLHDGTTAYIDQYSNMASVADLAAFSATISGANAVLQITPASANSTQFTFNRIATKV